MRKISLLAQALAVAVAASHIPGAPRINVPQRAPRVFTHADEERLAKAQAKRDRKAARNLKNKEPSP